MFCLCLAPPPNVYNRPKCFVCVWLPLRMCITGPLRWLPLHCVIYLQRLMESVDFKNYHTTWNSSKPCIMSGSQTSHYPQTNWQLRNSQTFLTYHLNHPVIIQFVDFKKYPTIMSVSQTFNYPQIATNSIYR